MENGDANDSSLVDGVSSEFKFFENLQYFQKEKNGMSNGLYEFVTDEAQVEVEG